MNTVVREYNTVNSRRIPYVESIFCILVIASLVPDIGIKVSIFGFNWTLYRALVFISLLVVLITEHGRIYVKGGSQFIKWNCFMIMWLLYGVTLSFISEFTNIQNAVPELVSLASAIVVIYVASMVDVDESFLNRLINIFAFAEIAFIALGFFEIITGMHLPVSMLEDIGRIAENINADRNVATGIMYNVNDFSAFLTILLPFCMMRKWVRWPAITGVIIINHINDANICNLAVIAGIGLHLVLIHKVTQDKRLKILFLSAVAILSIIIFFELLGFSMFTRINIVSRIELMVENAKNLNGSLYARLIMYKDLIEATISTYGMGLGPRTISVYFDLYPSKSKLVNPHSLPLEILAQYGIVIFSWFCVRVYCMFREAYDKLKKNRDNQYYYLALELLTLYIIGSFASSSFLGYSYQWAIIAFVCCVLSDGKREGVAGGTDR